MKVVHIIDSYGFGGAERYIVDLVKGLNKNGKVCATVISFGFNQFLAEQSIPYTSFSETKNISSKTIMSEIKRIHSIEPDTIFHTHGYRANILVRMALFFKKAKIISTIHSTFKYWKNPIKKRVYPFLDKLTSVKNNTIITVSDYISDYYKTILNRKKLLTVYNGVDDTIFTKKKPSNDSITRLITVGSLNDVKNHITLLKAFNHIVKNEKHSDLELVLVGQGPKETELRKFIVEHDLVNNVTLLGYLKNVHNQLIKSDLYISTSTDESFGLSIVEAMFTGLPVVSSRVGGVVEIIESGHNGILYNNPTDDSELSNQILRLLKDKELVKTLKENGYKTAASKFTINHLLKAVEFIYINN